jgi:hypothetical protein
MSSNTRRNIVIGRLCSHEASLRTGARFGDDVAEFVLVLRDAEVYKVVLSVAVEECPEVEVGLPDGQLLEPHVVVLTVDSTVAEATLTSSSGINWWLHLFSPRSPGAYGRTRTKC